MELALQSLLLSLVGATVYFSSTKKNTKAVEDNTRKFNISDISRQAFDAAFNVKLKEAFITTI